MPDDMHLYTFQKKKKGKKVRNSFGHYSVNKTSGTRKVLALSYLKIVSALRIVH